MSKVEGLQEEVIEENGTDAATEEKVVVPKELARRGMLAEAGNDVADFTDEQLKRERINSNSCLAKAKKRNAAQETIDNCQKRVTACAEEITLRKPVVEKTEEVIEEA